MRRLTLAALFTFALLSHAPSANAGIVDITYEASSGDLFLRVDPGLDLIAVAMIFGGGASGSFVFEPFGTPPNISEIASIAQPVGSDYVVQLNPPAVVAEVINTNGATILVGNFSGASITSFDCSDCFMLFSGGVVDEDFVDHTSQTSYVVVPEPSSIALFGLVVAGLVTRRSLLVA